MAEADSTEPDRMCPSCSTVKPLSAFHRSNNRADGTSYECKPCSAERSRRTRTTDPDTHRERRRAYYQKNRNKIRAAAQEKYQRTPELTRIASWRKSGINLSWDGYLLLLADQDGSCALCKKSPEANGKALAVDHDHNTGRIRGLLCDDCNIALGRFQDSPEILRRALHYLGTP